MKKTVEYYKEHHICTKCHIEKVRGPYTVCLSCRAKNAQYLKTRYELYKRLGLCVACGEPLGENAEHIRCTKCREKHRVSTYARRHADAVA